MIIVGGVVAISGGAVTINVVVLTIVVGAVSIELIVTMTEEAVPLFRGL